MASGAIISSTLTRSRGGDLALFSALLVLMLAFAPRLRVYFGVTVIDVQVTRIDPDGSRTALPTPGKFVRAGNGYWGPDEVIEKIRPQIDRYVEQSDWRKDAPEAMFEWLVRWGRNSMTLDREYRYVWGADAKHE